MSVCFPLACRGIESSEDACTKRFLQTRGLVFSQRADASCGIKKKQFCCLIKLSLVILLFVLLLGFSAFK